MFTRLAKTSLSHNFLCIVSLLFLSSGCSTSSPAPGCASAGAAACGGLGGGDADGAPASECTNNAACTDSEAAKAIAMKKCLEPEVYCLEGKCVGSCADVCVVARADFNPCQQGLCAPSPYEASAALSFCTMLPVKCATAKECPKVLPPSPDGSTGQWSCENGICRYPGFEYPTH